MKNPQTVFVVTVGGERWTFKRSATGVMDLDPKDEDPEILGMVGTERLVANPRVVGEGDFWCTWGPHHTEIRIWAWPERTTSELGEEELRFLTVIPGLLLAIKNGDSWMAFHTFRRLWYLADSFRSLAKYLGKPLIGPALLAGWWGDGFNPPALERGVSLNPVEAAFIETLGWESLASVPVDDRPSFLLKHTLESVGLTVPLVGMQYAAWENEGLERIAKAWRKLEQDNFFDPGVRLKLTSLFGQIHVSVQAEPWNKYDPNALKVSLTDANGSWFEAGFLRRTLAALLAKTYPGRKTYPAELVRIENGGKSSWEPNVFIRLRV